MKLETEAYVIISPGHPDKKLTSKMVFLPTTKEVYVQFYLVDDVSEMIDPDFFSIDVRGF
jgi:hypothetical protein